MSFNLKFKNSMKMFVKKSKKQSKKKRKKKRRMNSSHMIINSMPRTKPSKRNIKRKLLLINGSKE